MNNKKGFKILHLNTRSIYKKLDEIFTQYDNFDVLAFSETWLNNKFTDAILHKENFVVLRQDRNRSIVNKKGGGVMFYIKNNMKIYTDRIEEISNTQPALEQLWVHIHTPSHKKKVIGVIYRPPNSKIKDSINVLRNSIRYVKENLNGELYIMGDLLKKRNSDVKQVKDLFRDYGLNQYIKDPTRITFGTSTLIDIMATDSNVISEAGVLLHSISDHLPVYMIRKKGANLVEKEKNLGRSYRNYSYEAMKFLIENNNKWKNFWEKDRTVDELWDIMYDIFLTAVDQTCPIHEVTYEANKPSWLTFDLREHIRVKNRLYKKACSSHDIEHWEDFRVQKKLVREKIYCAKNTYVRKVLNDESNNPRLFWKKLNSLIGKRRENVLSQVYNDDHVLIQGETAAEYMNKYYTEIAQNLSGNLNADWNDVYINNVQCDSIFAFDFVTEEEVLRYVNNIKIDKSSGIEGINSRVLKDCFKICNFELTYLFNTSFDTSMFPIKWAKSIITPIPKDGDYRYKENWRPINNLPLPGKLLERCVHRRLSEYLEVNTLLSDAQHGFRKNYSTTSGVMDFVTYLYDQITANLKTSVCYVDYAKAFDTIDHSLLLMKLEKYGIIDNTNRWSRSYLGNREQCTKVGITLSAYLPVETGVPQGSILGPVLFILFINDLLANMKSKGYMVNVYADDTVLATGGVTWEQSCSYLIISVDYLMKWCSVNKLVINVKKTKYMEICCKGNNARERSVLKGSDWEIGKVTQYNYLGVIIDSGLSFGQYMDNILNRVNQKLFIMSKVRPSITLETALLLYKQTIVPIMEYIGIVMDSSTRE